MELLYPHQKKSKSKHVPLPLYYTGSLAGKVETGRRSVDQFLRFKIDRFKIDMDAGP